jgi:hypothetical protein
MKCAILMLDIFILMLDIFILMLDTFIHMTISISLWLL